MHGGTYKYGSFSVLVFLSAGFTDGRRLLLSLSGRSSRRQVEESKPPVAGFELQTDDTRSSSYPGDAPLTISLSSVNIYGYDNMHPPSWFPHSALSSVIVPISEKHRNRRFEFVRSKSVDLNESLA